MPDIRLQRGDGNLGLRGIDTPDNEPDRAVSVAYLEAHTSGNSAHPFNEWVSGTDYAVGDQVLYGIDDPDADLRGVYSIYIRIALTQEQIDAGVTVNNTTPPEVSGTTAGWRLLRSGIVSLSTNDGAGAAGLTSNSTLRINHGAGIDVNRSATTYTISTHSTSSSDVNDFMPGWAYSYFNLIDNTTHTGTVGVRQTGFEIDAVENIDGNVYLHIDFQDPNSFDPGDHFAFRTFDGNTRTQLFGADATADRIIYAIQDSNPELVLIAAVDAPVSTLGELRTLFNVPSGTRSITPISFQNLFTLDEHHSGQTGTAPWAQTGNDTNIPTDKLGGLSSDVLAPNTVFTINDAWLPDDIIRSTTTNVITRNAVDDTTTGESLVVAADGVATLTLDHQPDVVNDLSDVNFTQPTETPVVEGLLWDATEMEWINSPVTQTLEGLTDTAVPTPGNEQYLRYSTERGNDAQGDPLPPAWVAVDLPETADGRIEFTALDADTYEASAFIPDRANPEDPLPAARAIRSAGFVNSQLRFNLATATTLTLTVQNFSPPNLAWDVPFAGGTRQAIGSTDTLFPDQVLQNLFTNSGNITIAPTSGPGPWTISFTDPSLVGDPNDAGDQLAGGSTTAIAFRATNSVTGANADESGMVVSWNSAGLTVNDQRFPTNPTFFNTFLDPYTGFNVNYTVTATGTTLTNSAVWTANGTTIAGNGTVGPTANTGTNTNSIGGNAGAVRINSDYVTYHGQPDVPTDIIRVEFNRPDGVSTAGAYTVALTHNASSQPNWFYPIGSFSQEGTPTDPDMATIRTSLEGGFRQGTTDPTDPIPNFSISLANSGTSSRSLYVAYPSDSSDAPNYPTNPLVITQITTLNGSSSGPVNVTIAEANHSAAPINIISDAAGTPADSGVNYNWFRVTVAPNATVDITAINP